MDNPQYGMGGSKFVGGRKYNPMFYIYYYGMAGSGLWKLKAKQIGEDFYILTYLSGNNQGELHRLGPDNMEVVEHGF
jgi:hypothetical protein